MAGAPAAQARQTPVGASYNGVRPPLVRLPRPTFCARVGYMVPQRVSPVRSPAQGSVCCAVKLRAVRARGVRAARRLRRDKEKAWRWRERRRQVRLSDAHVNARRDTRLLA